MPGGDRTGPTGMGPRTGRGAGYCGGASAPGFLSAGRGRGWFGRGGRGGRGGGRGWRNMFFATGLTGWQRAAVAGLGAVATSFFARPFPAPAAPPAEQELDALKRQADYLSGALGEIRQRIDELQQQAARPE